LAIYYGLAKQSAPVLVLARNPKLASRSPAENSLYRHA
jgi:hypothetical protein